MVRSRFLFVPLRLLDQPHLERLQSGSFVPLGPFSPPPFFLSLSFSLCPFLANVAIARFPLVKMPRQCEDDFSVR